MAETKKKGKWIRLVGMGLIVLFAFAALVPTLWAWIAFWGLTAAGAAFVVVYQRRRHVTWSELLMDGEGAHRRTARVVGGWLAAVIFLSLAAYTRRHLQEAEGALVGLAVVSAIIWYALTGRFMLAGKKRT